MISSCGSAPHRPAAPSPDGPAGTEETAKLAERQADRDLFERLQTRAFDKDSEEWRHLADEVARYATGVLVAWARRGRLRSMVLRRSPGGSRLPEDLVLDDHDARSLINEVLVVSLENYRTRSLPAWNPDGGASLTTWFINRCLYDLPDVFKRWERHELQPIPTDIEIDDGRHCQLLDDQVTDRMLLDDILEDDPDLREVLELRDAGHSREEIADKLGQSVAAMRSKTNRAKQRIRQRFRKEVN